MNDDKTVIKIRRHTVAGESLRHTKARHLGRRQFLHLDVLFHNESDKVFGIGHNIPQERALHRRPQPDTTRHKRHRASWWCAKDRF